MKTLTIQEFRALYNATKWVEFKNAIRHWFEAVPVSSPESPMTRRLINGIGGMV